MNKKRRRERGDVEDKQAVEDVAVVSKEEQQQQKRRRRRGPTPSQQRQRVDRQGGGSPLPPKASGRLKAQSESSAWDEGGEHRLGVGIAATAASVNDSLNSSRRRRLRRRQQQERTDDGSETKPLSGILVSISTSAGKEPASGAPGGAAAADNYKGISELCRRLGARTTGQVHRKVDCVLASKTAVDGDTQRVRKARKKGVPVVDIEWLRNFDGGATTTYIPFDAYVIAADDKKPTASIIASNQTNLKQCATSEAAAAAAAAAASAVPVPSEIAGWSEAVDLGCCCVCHESGAPIEDDCPWCVECSVMQEKRISPINR